MCGLSLAQLMAFVVVCSGCAAITNPVANGLPARLLPPELLTESKEGLEDVPLRNLQGPAPESYRLGPGDILAVYVESVLGEEGQLPPINLPDIESKLQPSVGFPLPVLEDGTLPLPLLDPLKVEGMTVVEARNAIFDAYRSREIILPEEKVVLVTVIRPRQVRVLVIREDSPSNTRTNEVQIRPIRGFTSNPIGEVSRRGTGDVVELPAYQNDLLTALAKSGGLPGSDAVNEVIIQRGAAKWGQPVDDIRQQPAKDNGTIRIPLRLRPGEPLPFGPSDVVLHEGDIVFVKARPPEAFYTGGLLPAIKVPMPRDEDIDILEAISLIGGPMLNGGVNGNNISGTLVIPGIGNPSPSLLTVVRRTPTGQQFPIYVDLNRALVDARERILIQNGDLLLLQETPAQAIARYITNVFQLNFLATPFNRGDAVGTASATLP
jgi:protein involved in polysaccharide export with SLBB domain